MSAAAVWVPAACLASSAVVALVVTRRRALWLRREEARMRRYAAAEAPEKGRRVGIFDFTEPALLAKLRRRGADRR